MKTCLKSEDGRNRGSLADRVLEAAALSEARAPASSASSTTLPSLIRSGALFGELTTAARDRPDGAPRTLIHRVRNLGVLGADALVVSATMSCYMSISPTSAQKQSRPTLTPTATSTNATLTSRGKPESLAASCSVTVATLVLLFTLIPDSFVGCCLDGDSTYVSGGGGPLHLGNSRRQPSSCRERKMEEN